MRLLTYTRRLGLGSDGVVGVVRVVGVIGVDGVVGVVGKVHTSQLLKSSKQFW